MLRNMGIPTDINPLNAGILGKKCQGERCSSYLRACSVPGNMVIVIDPTPLNMGVLGKKFQEGKE